ncbi:hypothetical protein AK812_SmicGene2561 [Symbiodinium microadriaticum]|uniref:PsbP C-terminal domain-containing protein n=1 Tax=Symbiodinium microadriaticum TaxID=2951 RepID=A0A1Q9F123_SYMMI|nr:hypothetical protein AK812_SmicGene2561 [Symbiodinium microadriaticum]
MTGGAMSLAQTCLALAAEKRLGVYNISMPPRYKLKKNVPGLLAWQGDRLQPTEVMTAKAKAVEFKSLTQAVLRLRIWVYVVRINSTIEAALFDASVDPYETGLDIYRFEWVSDFIHEYKLYALLKAEGKNYLCSVNVRTPALLWEENKELFEYILKSFMPLEAQPNRTVEVSAASSAPVTAPVEASEGAL